MGKGDFQYKGFWCLWLPKSPANRASYCDATNCRRRVERNEPRLRIDNGLGPKRKRGKGTRCTYICEGCAEEKGVPRIGQGQDPLF